MRRKTQHRSPDKLVVEIRHCPECHHRWDDYTQEHYPDCRYFILDEEHEEEIEEIYFAQANQQGFQTPHINLTIS